MKEIAAAAVAEYIDAPATIGIAEPLGQAVPADKTVAFITAGPGGTGIALTQKALQEAAEKVGWTIKVIEPESPAPQAMQQALTQAIQLNPDAVIMNSGDVTALKTQLAELKDKGIPVVQTFGFTSQEDQVDLSFFSTGEMARLAGLTADAAVAKLDAPGEFGVVTIEGYPAADETVKGFTDRLTELCSECTTVPIVLSLASLGGSAGTDIVNAYRANPNMQGIFVPFDQLSAALFPAAQQAGVDLPPVYVLATVPGTILSLQSGDIEAAVQVDNQSLGWRYVDALSRIFTDQIESAKAVQQLPSQLWSNAYDNVPEVPSDGTFPTLVEDYKDQYEALWK